MTIPKKSPFFEKLKEINLRYKKIRKAHQTERDLCKVLRKMKSDEIKKLKGGD